jgi:hypothetical protein
LRWQPYFNTGKIPPDKNRWWFIGGAVAMALLLISVGSLLFYNRYSQREIIFSDRYPSVETITITEDSQEYNIEAVSGHVLMFFSNITSHSAAKKMIEKHGGKIIEQIPKFDYYLAEVGGGNENSFIAQMRQDPDVEYVFLNTINYAQSVYIMDSFSDGIGCMTINHGKEVRKIFEKYSSNNSNMPVNEIEHEYTFWEKANLFNDPYDIANMFCKRLMQVVDKSEKDELVLINRSIAVGNGLGRDKECHTIQYNNISNSKKRSYRESYLKGLKKMATCFQKLEENGKSNFIITNSSGNEGFHNMELVLNKLDSKNLDILKRHLVLVNAIDNKSIDYSNNTQTKNQLTTAIDISKDKFPGTSFAAPKLLGYIDIIHNANKELSASKILQAVRNATPQDPKQPLQEEILKSEAKKIAKVNEYIPKSETYNITDIDFTGHWATSGFDFQLSLKQIGNQISGTTHSNDYGGNVADVQYTLSGTVSDNIATVKYYSDYWEQNMKGSIKYLTNDQIEWTQIPQKGRDMPGKTVLYRYTPVQSVISHKEQEKIYEESEHNKSIHGNETFTIEANGNQNYQNFYLRDGSLIQCGLYSFGLGDLTLKVTNFAPYPISVNWTLKATNITPLPGFGPLSSKGQADNRRVWNDLTITGEHPRFYSATIKVDF